MRVKTVATLGPSSSNIDTMREMVRHGVRIFRLNFSHSNAATFKPIVDIIRQLEAELNKPLTAMGDLCGPKVRIGEVEGSPKAIPKGCTILLGLPTERAFAPTEVDGRDVCAFTSLDIPELLLGLEPGMPVSLSDGMLQFTVTDVLKPDALYAMRAETDGLLTSNKGIAFPGKFHPMPALTDKDIKDLHEGLDIGIDAVALSFVQSHTDIDDLLDQIAKHGRKVAVVAKLERKNALDDLDAILARVDAVMVARGDLGLECPMSELPVIQKRILRAARHAQKAAIVATQMLLSMVDNPLPTRAETTDVANAILDGADCVMLSEETAIGKDPVRVVSFIESIAESAEAYYLERIQGPFAPKREKNLAKHMAFAATMLAEQSDSRAIVCHSTSGSTARLMSSRRAAPPVYALTPDERVVRALNFFWGVHPRSSDVSIERHMDRVESFVQQSQEFQTGDKVILTSGQPTPGQQDQYTNSLKIYHK